MAGWEPLPQERWNATRVENDAALHACPPNRLQRLVIGLANHSFLKRGTFRATMARLIFAIGGGRPLDIAFRGAMFRLSGTRNLIEYGILLNPDYNRQDIDFLCGASGQDGVFVDIGSNIGLYSLPLAVHAGRTGRVIAIDANPLMADRLSLNARLSHLSNVTAIASAVSDREGSGMLAVRDNDDAIVALQETEDGPIRVSTLAALLERQGVTRLDGLKIDIEGHEDKALPPFLDAADDALRPRRIVIERAHPDYDYPKCVEAFQRHGYRLVGRTRNNSLYERTVS